MRDEGKLSDADHEQMDEFLGAVLDGYKNESITRGAAIGYLAHVMAALDLDNYAEAKSWFKNHREFIAEGSKISRSSGR
ncbi:hypothetical protein H8Z72_22555 (plasmid) [Xanthomonas citri pv. citri]|uniref:hypothetical protein n=1 Tax=Xanthomonas citri TaxID=346 RepID=UPI001931F30C|nr:hypothetical protein [Xanthomonas citri]QRD62688.1 hypothetical protein H8Z74_23630 [Xanthomonas citri pv. citri]QRD67223.1 hypothetical protein H8Z73_22610 [Xanthomonas citri pv. citri]QRD71732.1 hypothetical protein H8Z72_22555 [Xanthomonas citri pv. citri]